jgi:hypothetical protein
VADAPVQQPATTGPRCLVCDSAELRRKTVRLKTDPTKTCRVHICRDCGYIRMPKKAQSFYRATSSADELPSGGARVGTLERRGREFHMAAMAVDILGRTDLEVLVYGAGRNLDNHHIAELTARPHVASRDIMKVRDDAEFIDVTEPAPRRFPIVVASEVVEHFRRPRPDFAKLFSFVEPDGLLVCGTNIHAGGPLARDRYIFYRDHTSYYSPESLRRIANEAGFHLDFRAPLLGEGMRKRYVLFSRSQEVMQSVACYFGAELCAPSEVVRPRRPPKRRNRGLRPR